jgi:hypothetical protein
VTRVQALAVAGAGVACVAAALVWLFGAWALLGSGLVLLTAALLVPVREEDRGEPALDPALPPPDFPVHP